MMHLNPYTILTLIPSIPEKKITLITFILGTFRADRHHSNCGVIFLNYCRDHGTNISKIYV